MLNLIFLFHKKKWYVFLMVFPVFISVERENGNCNWACFSGRRNDSPNEKLCSVSHIDGYCVGGRTEGRSERKKRESV